MHRMTAGLVFSLLLVVLPAMGAINSTTTRKFNVTDGGKLAVEADLGDIQILTGGSGLRVDVLRTADVTDRARGEEILSKYAMTFEQHGNEVAVRGKYDSRFGILGWFSADDALRVRYVIHIPSRFNITLKTSGGNIDVGALSGVVEARTSGGNIKQGSVQGPVTLRTSGGDIRLDGATGKIELKTSGGSIRVDDVGSSIDARTSGGSIRLGRTAGEVYARSSGGGIRLDSVAGSVDALTSGGSVEATFATQPRGTSRLATSGGDVIVGVPASISVDLDAQSSGGDVESDLPITIQGARSGNSVIGRINGGGPQLTLRTSGGGIHVKRSS